MTHLDGNAETVFCCAFCNKPYNKVKKLIAGAGPNLYVCDECVAVCSSVLEHVPDGVRAGHYPGADVLEPSDELLCAFCGRTEAEGEGFVLSTKTTICRKCIGLCRDILKDEALQGEKR